MCDILDAGRLNEAVQEFSPDALVHLAARIDLDEKTNLAGYAANIEGVQNLIAAVRLTPSIRRAIWTSSQLVCRVGYVPRNDTDYTADTLYGQSKVRTEQIVREQRRRRTRMVPGPPDHGLGTGHERALPAFSSHDRARILLSRRQRPALEIL